MAPTQRKVTFHQRTNLRRIEKKPADHPAGFFIESSGFSDQ